MDSVAPDSGGLVRTLCPSSPCGLYKGHGCGNWIRMRPLPLSENGLKGLLDCQSLGPPESRDVGPGWGWCTAGKRSKAGKEKTNSAL